MRYNRRRASLTQPLMMRHDYGSYESDLYADELEADELYARFETGKKVNVPKYLEEHGNPEAAEAWKGNAGKIKEINEGKVKPVKTSSYVRLAKLKQRYLTASKEGKLADDLLGSLDYDISMEDLLNQADQCEEMASSLESALESQDVDTLLSHGVISSDLASAVKNGISALYEATNLVKDKITALQSKALECRSKARGLRRYASEQQADVDGNYMSVSHIGEMQDMLGVLSERIQSGMPMEDWVESKIAHAHQILGDLASYFYYGGNK
jgi:hypothetical protein